MGGSIIRKKCEVLRSEDLGSTLDACLVSCLYYDHNSHDDDEDEDDNDYDDNDDEYDNDDDDNYDDKEKCVTPLL